MPGRCEKILLETECTVKQNFCHARQLAKCYTDPNTHLDKRKKERKKKAQYLLQFDSQNVKTKVHARLKPPVARPDAIRNVLFFTCCRERKSLSFNSSYDCSAMNKQGAKDICKTPEAFACKLHETLFPYSAHVISIFCIRSWGSKCGQNQYHWGTSSMSTWNFTWANRF